MGEQKKPDPEGPVPRPPGEKCSKTHRRANMEGNSAAQTGGQLRNTSGGCRASILAPSATSVTAEKIRNNRREIKKRNTLVGTNETDRQQHNTKAGLGRNFRQRTWESKPRGSPDRPIVPGVEAVSFDDLEEGVSRHLPKSSSVEESKDEEGEEDDTQTNTFEATFVVEATLVVSDGADAGQSAGFEMVHAKAVNNWGVAMVAFVIVCLVILASIFGTLFATSAVGNRKAGNSNLDATETQPLQPTVNPTSNVPSAATTTFSPSAMPSNPASASPPMPTLTPTTQTPTTPTPTTPVPTMPPPTTSPPTTPMPTTLPPTTPVPSTPTPTTPVPTTPTPTTPMPTTPVPSTPTPTTPVPTTPPQTTPSPTTLSPTTPVPTTPTPTTPVPTTPMPTTPPPTTPTPTTVSLLPTEALAADGSISIAPTSSCINEHFQPLGQDLFGSAYEWFGTSVDLDDSGSILAVGAERGDYVQVYVYDDNRKYEPWSLMGQQLDGPPGSNFGNSVSLSGNGRVLACGGELVSFGLVRVYKYVMERNEWQQMGQDLTGEETTDDFGFGVALSWNGKMLAVGTFERGENVHVYRYESDTDAWVQIGSTLRGPTGSFFGGSLDFASNGTVLAVGAARGAAPAGLVRVFEYDTTAEDWTQIGAEVTGDYIGSDGSSIVTYDWFGSDFAVKLSSDGTTLAVGAWGANYAKVFAWDSSIEDWVQKGQQIDGQIKSRLGISVALSSDGTFLAVGEDWPEGGHGHVYVFSFNGATQQWDSLQDIEGNQPNDWFGWCVAMSQDGSVLAAGSLGAGQARVFSAKGCRRK